MVAFGVLLDTFLVSSVPLSAIVLKLGSSVWWPSSSCSASSSRRGSNLERRTDDSIVSVGDRIDTFRSSRDVSDPTGGGGGGGGARRRETVVGSSSISYSGQIALAGL